MPLVFRDESPGMRLMSTFASCFYSLLSWTHLRSLFAGNVFDVYTDGSHKEGHGSWAYVIVRAGRVVKEASGYCKNGTSNRMEFQAAIEALRFLPENSRVKIFTDSQIMIENITKRIPIWKSYGWETKSDIPNIDLLKDLDRLNETHNVAWNWVKAHSGVIYNERCDQLCKEARS